MDADDLSAETGKQLVERWFLTIEMYRSANVIGIGEDEWKRLEERIDRNRKAVVEACRKACNDRLGLYGDDYDEACVEIAQAIAGVGEEK